MFEDNPKGRHLPPLARMGQTLFYPICRGMVVPVRITEISDVYAATPEVVARHRLTSETLWVHFVDGEKRPEITGYTVPADDSERGFVRLPVEAVEGATHMSQTVWIDEVVGHELTVGDDVFTTLQDALRHAEPIDRRSALRRHKKVQRCRNARAASVASTRGNDGPVSPPAMARKPVWVRIGPRVFGW